MIEVPITKDAHSYEPKIIWNLTGRQLKCVIIAMVCAFPVALLVPGDILIKCIAAVIAAMPAIFCMFPKIYGLYFEQLVLKIVETKVLKPKIRKYKTENMIEPDFQVKKVQRYKETNRIM